ncbi:MAG: hypothetical protein GY793_04275 [Proteobacteria bacterium]|nr:hypothetical protein [Pseudomonadota bacterium]
MNKEQERRENYPMSADEMYRKKALDDYIQRERREDEKDRLLNVKQQKRVWFKVISACGLMIIILLTFATIGYINNG